MLKNCKKVYLVYNLDGHVSGIFYDEQTAVAQCHEPGYEVHLYDPYSGYDEGYKDGYDEGYGDARTEEQELLNDW